MQLSIESAALLAFWRTGRIDGLIYGQRRPHFERAAGAGPPRTVGGSRLTLDSLQITILWGIRSNDDGEVDMK